MCGSLSKGKLEGEVKVVSTESKSGTGHGKPEGDVMCETSGACKVAKPREIQEDVKVPTVLGDVMSA